MKKTVNLEEYRASLSSTGFYSDDVIDILVSEQEQKNIQAYKELYLSVLSDGKISGIEREYLENERIRLGLPVAVTENIKKDADRAPSVIQKKEQAQKEGVQKSRDDVEKIRREIMLMEHYYHHHMKEGGLGEEGFAEAMAFFDAVSSDESIMQLVSKRMKEERSKKTSMEVAQDISPDYSEAENISTHSDFKIEAITNELAQKTVYGSLDSKTAEKLCSDPDAKNVSGTFRLQQVIKSVEREGENTKDLHLKLSVLLNENGKFHVIEINPFDRTNDRHFIHRDIRLNLIRALNEKDLSLNITTLNHGNPASPGIIASDLSESIDKWSRIISNMHIESVNIKGKDSERDEILNIYKEPLIVTAYDKSCNRTQKDYTYGPAGLEKIVNEKGEAVEFHSYDRHNNETFVDSQNIYETSTYDSKNRITEKWNHLNNDRASYTYDEKSGLLVAVNHTNGFSQVFTYGKDNRQLEEHIYRNGTKEDTVKSFYDNEGRLVKNESEKNGIIFYAEYDDKGNLLKQNTLATSMSFHYDANGRLVKQNEVSDNIGIERFYNNEGLETKFVRRAGENIYTENYEYDKKGRVILMTDSTGREVSCTWNEFVDLSKTVSKEYGGKNQKLHENGVNKDDMKPNEIIEKNSSLTEEKEIQLTGELFEKTMRELLLQSDRPNHYDAAKYIRNDWGKDSYKNNLLDKYFESKGINTKKKFDHYFEETFNLKKHTVQKKIEKPAPAKKAEITRSRTSLSDPEISR